MGRREEMRGAHALWGHGGVQGSGVGYISGPWAQLAGSTQPLRPAFDLHHPTRPGSNTPPLGLGSSWVPSALTGHVQTCAGKWIQVVSSTSPLWTSVFPPVEWVYRGQGAGKLGRFRRWRFYSLLGHLLMLLMVCIWEQGGSNPLPSAWYLRP